MALTSALALALVASPVSDGGAPRLQHFQDCASRTGGSATVILPARADIAVPDAPLEAGDEVAVLTPSGTCAGAAVWDGEAVALTVWQDDPFTPEIDGLAPGDPLAFVVYDVSQGIRREAVTIRLDELAGGEDVYAPDALFVAEEGGATPEADAPTPLIADLGQNYPNPALMQTTVPFALAEAGDVTLEVFDALGRRVAQPVTGQRAAGPHTAALDVAGFAPGLYVYRLTVGGTVRQRSLLVSR